MLFTTDKQTIEDLNIFGKHGSDSVYTIFNRCTTRGGAAILEDMFRYPLNDEIAINKRSGIIKYFSTAGIDFPFAIENFDAIEQYLGNTDERTKLSAQVNSVSKKLGDLIGVDAETSEIFKGIKAIIELLRSWNKLINALKLSADDFYLTEAIVIKELLAIPTFHPILNEVASKLSHTKMEECDLIFRFSHRRALQQLLSHTYYLDVYLSIARVASERNFAFANARARNLHHLRIEGIKHPQVENAVANSIDITSESNVIFLTGANMAGKSTFMKSLSICLFLAHMGFPVSARSMEFSVLDGIYTTINLPDDLGIGASHFYAEVLRVKKVANELAQDKSLFVVFDELFRGTNVKDAYDATIALTGAFATKRNSIFLISTHIIEAGVELKKQRANIRFVYLPTKMNGAKPVYTYTLKEGITDDRHGMIIIKNEGILDILEKGISKQH